MLFWYAGIAVVGVYVTLGRRRIDFRMIVAGALLPGLIDGAAGALGLDAPDGRGMAHSFLAPVTVAVAVVVVTRGPRRLSLFGLAVGWLFHLVADGMWSYPRTFLWPAFGTDFLPAGDEPNAASAFSAPVAHWTIWLKEVAGLVALVWFWVAFRLGDPARRRLFARDGFLRA